MAPSEIAIIYLATAAPFGVARFFKEHERGERRRLARAAAAALLWPLAALRLVSKNLSRQRDKPGDETSLLDERRVESVKRSTVNALRAVEDLLTSERGAAVEAKRHALFAARQSVERYAGLALACASARDDDAPSTRETELFRVAGRAGDDLLVAGQCVRRRNHARLLAHRERARSELVHSLAAALETTHNALGIPRDALGVTRGAFEVAHGAREVTRTLYPAPRTFNSTEWTGGDASEEVSESMLRKETSEALLRALSRAVELLSLLDDRAAVVSVARLLDAESVRLARLEACAPAGTAAAGRKEGEESCTTQAAPKAFATPPLLTKTSHGG
jgi:hypothetical protein